MPIIWGTTSQIGGMQHDSNITEQAAATFSFTRSV